MKEKKEKKDVEMKEKKDVEMFFECVCVTVPTAQNLHIYK